MKHFTVIMIGLGLVAAACLLPQQSQAGGVSVGIGIAVPAPVVAYPAAPAYYPPAYYAYPYGPAVVAAPAWGYGYHGPHHHWRSHRAYRRRHGW